MTGGRSLRGTRRYIQTHWPIFFGLYGALVLAILMIGFGLAFAWYALVPFALAITLIAGYFLAASLWTIHEIYDGPGLAIMDVLLAYSQLRPEDKVVCIDLGLRSTALQIAQRLTTGEVTVIDVYNPRSNISSALRRARASAPRAVSDPRLDWIDGNIELLPLPDRSVGIIFMNQSLAEFWLPEERDRLLAEVWRILAPEGRLLVAERVRGRSNLIMTGLVTSSLPPAEMWRDLLVRAGFIIQREECLRGLVYCVRADKPSPTAGKQLPLLLEFL